MQKALGWIGLTIGGAGTLLVLWAIIVEGRWPGINERDIWFVPGSTVPLALIGMWVLFRGYRLEPAPKRPQLALADAITALVLFGAVLYVGSYAEEGVTLLRHWGVPALVIAGCYMAGVTRASYFGLLGWRRYAVGISGALMFIGCLGVGALIVLLVYTASVAGTDYCADMVLSILGVPSPWDNYLTVTFRVALLLLPVGLLLGLALRLTIPLPREPDTKRPSDAHEDI